MDASTHPPSRPGVQQNSPLQITASLQDHRKLPSIKEHKAWCTPVIPALSRESEDQFGVGEMARWVECLPSRQEDQSLVLQHLPKKAQGHMSITLVLEWRRQANTGGLLASQSS